MLKEHDFSPASIPEASSRPLTHPVDPRETEAALQEAGTAPRCFLLTHHHHVLRSLERGAFWPEDDTDDVVGAFGLTGGVVPLFFAPLPAGWASHVCRGKLHLRPVAVEIYWRVLPQDDVPCVADGRWTRRVLGQFDTAPVRVVAWPREVLLRAVRAARFRSDVERDEVGAMMRDFASMAPDMLALSTEPGLFASATVAEPEPPAGSGDFEALMSVMRAAPSGAEPAIRGLDRESQRRIDALHGALSMLAWATPRMDGWLQFLSAALAQHEHGDTQTDELANTLGVPWLARLHALLDPSVDPASGELSGLLFCTAANVLMACAPRAGLDTEQLFARIIEATRTLAGKVYPLAAANELLDEIDAFDRAGRAVLGMDQRFRSSAFPNPVQQAIVLALLRPEPDKYRQWYSSEAAIAPGAWVTGAVLVGVLNGRARLPNDLCGNVHQQNDLAASAANLVAQARGLARWPRELTPRLEWRLQGAGRDTQILLESATGLWSSRAMSLRAHWSRADLDNPVVCQAAVELARYASWKRCLRFVVHVPDGQRGVLIKGAVDPTLTIEGPDHVLRARTRFAIELSDRSEIHEELDRSSFRHELACAGLDAQVLERFSAPLFQTAGNAGHPALQRDIHGIQGLDYLPAYITPDEEARLLAQIYGSPWSSELKRKVQHYGWRYDYKARQIDEGLRLGPLPPWAEQFAARLVRDGLIRQKPDQVIVNEYEPGQGISAHIDCEPCFAEDVAVISLQWAYEMEFTRLPKERVTHLLERCSLLVLRGAARYQWKHSIKGRKSDAGVPRGTRVSLTFRKVKVAS